MIERKPYEWMNKTKLKKHKSWLELRVLLAKQYLEMYVG